MNQLQQKSIQCFRKAIEGLKDCGVIRSHRYLGDLGEFLCADEFGIDLASNLRQVGHDGTLEKRRIQIKYHGGSSTTVNLGDPSSYDEVYIVLGPESSIRPAGQVEEFLVYVLSSVEVEKFESKNGNYHCTESRLPNEPTKRIGLPKNA